MVRLEGKAETRFAGYAAIFDRPDSSGDIIRRGAFKRAMAAGPQAIPLLWQHDGGRPIGVIEQIAEDDNGLRVIGRISDGTRTAREAGSLLGERAVDGLSFGYRVREAIAPPGGKTGGRQLTDLELVEVSLVTFPMQPLARVHKVEAPHSNNPPRHGEVAVTDAVRD